MMIVSHTRGRLRLRDPRFKNEELLNPILSALACYPGVSAASANPLTGGLLIHYDPDRIDQAEAARALAVLAPADDEPSADRASPASRPIGRLKPDYLALFTALGLCVGPLLGSSRLRQWHLWGGLVFLGLTGRHIYKYRSRLTN